MVTDGIMLDDLENLCELDAERSMVNQVVMDIEGINLKKKNEFITSFSCSLLIYWKI